MERNDIIKALECCESHEGDNCPNCPYHYTVNGYNHHCREDMVTDALSLIKELTEERDGFENLIHTMSEIENRMSETIEELTEENERLRSTMGVTKLIAKPMDEEEQKRLLAELKNAPIQILTDNSQTKVDTVRRMHSEIEKRCIKGGIYPAFVKSTIDQIAKEMLEGEK